MGARPIHALCTILGFLGIFAIFCQVLIHAAGPSDGEHIAVLAIGAITWVALLVAFIYAWCSWHQGDQRRSRRRSAQATGGMANEGGASSTSGAQGAPAELPTTSPALADSGTQAAVEA